MRINVVLIVFPLLQLMEFPSLVLSRIIERSSSSLTDSADITQFSVYETADIAEQECVIQSIGTDQCQFVKDHCDDIESGALLPYLQAYYCSQPAYQPWVLMALAGWLIIVFISMATAADEFLAENLPPLVQYLDISEVLAGVTIFAFGNGSSDLFSTFAAVSSNNGGLAIAELFGAALFICTVVLGVVMIFAPSMRMSRAFIYNISCFLIAALVTLVFIADGALVPLESLVLVGLYFVFVVMAVRRETVWKLDQHSLSPVVHSNEEATSTIGDTVEGDYHQNSSSTSDEVHDVPLLDEELEPYLDEESEFHDDPFPQASNGSSAFEVRACEDQMQAQPRTSKRMNLTDAWRKLLSVGAKLGIGLKIPARFVIGATTITIMSPSSHARSWNESGTASLLTRDMSSHPSGQSERPPTPLFLPLIAIQLTLGPIFVLTLTWLKTNLLSLQALAILCLVCPIVTIIIVLWYRQILLVPTPRVEACLLTHGLLTAMVWIYFFAAEAVAVITSLGVVFDISDGLLGATIFAIGNSSNDLIANLSIAKSGYPTMAANACIGGPFMNILLGIGLSSLTKALNTKSLSYEFDFARSILVSAISLLLALSVIIAYFLLIGPIVSRMLGFILILLWACGTITTVVVSMDRLS